MRGLIALENAFHLSVTGSTVGQAGCDLKLFLPDSCSMTFLKQAHPNQHLWGDVHSPQSQQLQQISIASTGGASSSLRNCMDIVPRGTDSKQGLPYIHILLWKDSHILHISLIGRFGSVRLPSSKVSISLK